jgi:hypothetical protein
MLVLFGLFADDMRQPGYQLGYRSTSQPNKDNERVLCNDAALTARRNSSNGIQTMTKTQDRKAIDDLVMQYRIERAARWMGKIGLLIFALAVLCALISQF